MLGRGLGLISFVPVVWPARSRLTALHFIHKMNIFKTLNGMVWGDNASHELVAITSGQFYVTGLNMPRTCR